jgi:hypothetical protein
VLNTLQHCVRARHGRLGTPEKYDDSCGVVIVTGAWFS